jgi:hypothetical protein
METSITGCYICAPKGWAHDKDGNLCIRNCAVLDFDVFLKFLKDPTKALEEIEDHCKRLGIPCG